MGITFTGLLFMIVALVLGYFRGILRILVAFCALLLSSLLAMPLSFTTAWAVNMITAVPLALKPVTGIITTGILFFIIFQGTGEYFIHRREKALKEDDKIPMSEGERYAGSVLGVLWGFCFVILVLTGLDVVATVQGTVDKVEQIAEQDIVVRRIGSSERPMPGGPLRRDTWVNTPSKPLTVELGKKERQSRLPVSNTMAENLKNELISSIYYPVVKRVTPVDEKAARSLEKLLTVTRDPALFDSFQKQPEVKKLSQNPKILELAKDPDIQKAIASKDYKALLNNPRIASMVNDRQILNDFRGFDIEKVLDQVSKEQQDEKAPQEDQK